MAGEGRVRGVSCSP